MMDQLSQRIFFGDVQGFELLFRKYYIPLCRFANKFLQDSDQAQEIVQDAFIKVWNGREDIDLEDSLKSYLFKIVQNLCLNKLKRIKIESKYLEIYKYIYIENREVSGHESLFAKELEITINLAIEKLPPQCRIVFDLSRNEGLKYKEIANTLHISIKTVEAQMSKALQIMRKELHEYLTILMIALICSNLIINWLFTCTIIC